MATVKGTVYRIGTQERVVNASVKAIGSDKEILHTNTNPDGNFELDVPDGTQWSLIAFHEDSLPSETVKYDSASGGMARLELVSRIGEPEQKRGFLYFYILLGVLGVLLLVYILLHLTIQPPISIAFTSLLVNTQDRLLDPGLEKISEDESLLASVEEINRQLDLVLNKNKVLPEDDKEMLRALSSQFEKAVDADEKDKASQALTALRLQFEAPLTPGFSLWDLEPWRLLEILFWAAAGILVNKIFFAGWYLYRQRFFPRAIVMHVAQLITTPLMVLVAVLLLSLVTLQVTISSGNELTLDLSDPRIMVAVAFLLGVVPWPLWNFIENTARRIIGQLD